MTTGADSRCQLAIVGGGVLGRVLGLLAAKAGWRDVWVFQLGGGDMLTADSQRNHSWWQSGLLYADSNRVVAAQMMLSGRNLMREAGVPPPVQRGVFRATEAEADGVLERSRNLGIP